MVQDPECAVVGTFSGAMSVAKMGLLICEMIDRGWLKVVITTGALVAHGFIETLGRAHYKYPEHVSDRELFQQGYNRIYDTLEMEANLDYAEDVFRAVLKSSTQDQVWSSASLCRELGSTWRSTPTAPGSCATPILRGCRFHPGLHRLGTGPGPGGLHGAPGPGGGAGFHCGPGVRFSEI